MGIFFMVASRLQHKLFKATYRSFQFDLRQVVIGSREADTDARATITFREMMNQYNGIVDLLSSPPKLKKYMRQGLGTKTSEVARVTFSQGTGNNSE